METIYVLVGYYSDNSGFSLKRAYVSKARADQDLALAKDDSTLQWALYELPITGPSYADSSLSVVDEEIPL